ncbi:hypothetical protein L208DRAFT_921336 [Tricholoma matsutake]|nr:hypothetical protein L208DRAFT_921336 [Tricholoma matsutake 945]
MWKVGNSSSQSRRFNGDSGWRFNGDSGWRFNGRLGGRARVTNVGGTDLTDNVNVMAVNLTLQVRTIAVATMAVDRGDLMQKIVGVRVSGEMLSLVNTINNMMDQLVIFGYEVKKVAREVGMEGKLRVQAEGQHHCREFDDSSQGLRTDICSSYGDSTRFIMVEASSEMDWLKTQINQMVFNLWDSIQKNMAARLRSSLTGARASS